MLAALWAASAGLAALSRGGDPPDPPRGSLFVGGLFVGLVPWVRLFWGWFWGVLLGLVPWVRLFWGWFWGVLLGLVLGFFLGWC
jgi:hypothetical protein